MRREFLVAAAGLVAVSAFAQSNPYAGEQHRQIKSLSPADIAALAEGQGQGFAKAAELNGYPGPSHVLEHARALGLSAQQETATKDLMQRHKRRARELGAALIEAERALDQGFSSRRIDEAGLARLMGEIGRLQAQLREEHLRTHLAQTAILTQAQVRRYDELRRYAGAAAAPTTGRAHRH